MTLPDGYTLETIVNSNTEPDTELEIGGMSTRPDGNLLTTTRGGELWEYNPTSGEWTLKTDGLHQTIGVLADEDDDIYVPQKPELTRLVDDTASPEIDAYETIADNWGLSGDYHEWTYGPVRDSEGNFYINLSLGAEGSSPCSPIMVRKGPYRGWQIKITPDGEFIPWANGFRSPLGIGINADDDVFYSDQHGDFVPVSHIAHVTEGSFHGHPISLADDPEWPDYEDLCSPGADIDDFLEARKPPVAWIPYNLCESPGGVTFDTQGNFGPFEGQAFYGDQVKANLSRMSMEKVNGEYQGATYPFTDAGEFQSGTVTEEFNGDGSGLYLGQTNRGFGLPKPEPYGLQRIDYDGSTVPFEMHSIEITSDGFRVNFTKTANAGEAGNTDRWSIAHWTYNYFSNYGSSRVTSGEGGEIVTANGGTGGQQTDISSDDITATVADGGNAVELTVPGLGSADVQGTRTVKGRIYEISTDISAQDGSEMANSVGWYTVNRTP